MKSERIVLSMVGVLVSATLVVGESEGKFPFTGTVKGNAVYVRSGPDVNYYPVARLMRDNQVQVVGEEYGWFKIVPPSGSFSCVSKDFVEKKEGNKGVVSGDRVAIRAGSSLNDKKTAIQFLASKGMEVTILGEEEKYYKIAPPEGAYVWVSAQYIKTAPAKQIPAAAATTEPATKVTPPASKVKETKPAVKESVPTNQATTETIKETPATGEKEGEAALESVTKEIKEVTTKPSTIPGLPGVTTVRREFRSSITTTQPDLPMGKLTKTIIDLDKKLLAEMKKPLDQRNFDALIPGYTAIAAQKGNKSAAKYAQDRLTLIEFQKHAKTGVSSLIEIQHEYTEGINKPGVPYKADVPDTNPETYRLQGCGQLRASLVFEGPLMPKRFRLFDPDKGRTVAYVELAPNVEINLSQYIGKNVAVYGASFFDAKLGFKVIKADAFKILENQPNIVNSPNVIE
jgi:SH3-like domain-containing protein